MNIGRLLLGIHRGACQAVHNVGASVSAKGLTDNVRPIVRTLMTGRFPSLLQPSSLNKSLYATPPPSAFPSQPVRTKVQFSRTTGHPRSVVAVMRRFFRLHNGQWIRTRTGRNKKKWRKTPSHQARLEEHVMCNRAQSKLLDRMIGPQFKKPKHYPNDPYAPYHKWDNLPHYRVLRNKPRFLP